MLDPSGNVYVGGKTTSNRSFPASGAVLFRPFQIYGCLLNTPEFGFISKLSPDGTRVLWSGLLPGDGTSIDDCGGNDIVPTVLANDGNGGVFAAGYDSSNHPVSMSRNNPIADDGDAFFAQIDGAGTVVYSTFISVRAPVRGIAVDHDGNVRVAGGGFLRQLSPNRVPVEVAARASPACADAPVTLDARVAAAGNVGNVDFLIDGALGATAQTYAGAASLATTLAAGVHRIQVRYQGNSPFNGARSPVLYLPVQQAGLC